MKNLLDEKSPVPLYHQLSRILREKIEREEWREGEQIPTELELCEEFGLSRGTVAQALRELEDEGLIYRKQGRGTFVAEKRLSLSLSHFYSFARDMEARGQRFYSKILRMEKETPSKSVQERLNVEQGEVFTIERLRFTDDIPVILEKIYLLPEFEKIASQTKELEEGVIYDIFLREMGVKVQKAREEFEVVRMNRYEAELFKVEVDFPALLVRRITFDKGGKPFEYRKSIIRADQCRYSVELEV
ncbi:MAG TPA: GntR family transcriptional regulator [Candidatus Atribacteria bacterium]|nr:GntR family transcriptional regulator [Candidatus Atribacteria bacterium]HQE25473.1 GntR family transcriptional regulator [Candidatus Atribacteria bacterium]